MCNKNLTILLVLMSMGLLLVAGLYIQEEMSTQKYPTINIHPFPPYDQHNISKTTVSHDGIEEQERSEEVLNKFIDASQP